MSGLCLTQRPTGQSPSKAATQIMSKASASSNAYINEGLTVQGRSAGPLSELTFAVKDMYDVCRFSIAA